VLTGSADLGELIARAPAMRVLDAGPLELGGADIVQAAFELPYAAREHLLPPGLHPTTPPLLVVLAWQVRESPWGRFSMAQARVSCRSGVRPRGFVAGGVVDNAAAGTALAEDWGLPAAAGSVDLRRGYDRVELVVTRDGTALAHVVATDPEPLDVADVQFTVTTTLAQTPRGARLVQVEPDYALRRAERARPRCLAFDPGAWGLDRAVPRSPVSATVSQGDISIPPLRFVSRPDVTAFEGTERI
jgi:hypothetical protein